MSSVFSICGTYRDTLVDAKHRVLLDGGWQSNQIVSGCFTLLAALMKGHQQARGILSLAVGIGDKGWDGQPPAPSPQDTRLERECCRKTLSPSDLAFLGPDNRPVSEPTSCLEISVRFTAGERGDKNGLRLREFALFGGDATDEKDSGVMINRVIHPRIDLASGTTLVRTLRLDFSGESFQEKALGTFGASLPLQGIDGIGKTYEAALTARGIHTLSDLARVVPGEHTDAVPSGKLLEFRTKARMILNFPPSLSALSGTSSRPLGNLIAEPPEALGTLLKTSENTPGKTLELHQALMSLQVAMTDDALRSLTINDLTPPSGN
ncbi:hypothetical protein [Desulfoluna butyratoxydans]|uniref:Uncharacterized protein n=1 Tax=Desulfoluna butyratoxydans TaxID=231438 RepID=A0A4U8YS63_9BACT|nr:hypothetical protein [Desulfoluna butyratoxydans]VFQ46337.1 hypothetical protein MSL71_40010 [Desulfoluna butyratoxydans]